MSGGGGRAAGERMVALLEAGDWEGYDELWARSPDADLPYEAVRRLYRERLDRPPVTGAGRQICRRLLAAGHPPSPGQWERVLDPAAWREEPTLGMYYTGLAAIVDGVGARPWMLERLYEVALEAPEADWPGITDPPATYSSQLAAVRAALCHENTGEELLARFGFAIGAAEGGADGGRLLEDVLTRKGPAYWFSKPVFVRAVMAGGARWTARHVIQHAPDPWPARAFRRLAGERPAAIGDLLEGPDADAMIGRLAGRLGSADVRPLLAADEVGARQAGVRLMGRLEREGGEPSDGEAVAARVAALAAGDLAAYDRRDGQAPIPYEQARAIYRDRLGGSDVDEVDLGVCRRLLAMGYAPTREQWRRACERAAAVDPSRRVARLEALRRVLLSERVPAWMRTELFERTTAPAGLLAPHHRVDEAGMRATIGMLKALLAHPDPSEALLARAGFAVGGATGDGPSLHATHALWEEGGVGEALMAREPFVEALMASDPLRCGWDVVAHAPAPWPVRAFRRMARRYPEQAALPLREETAAGGRFADRAARQAVLEKLGREEVALLLEAEDGAVRQAAVMALGRLEAGEGESEEVAAPTRRGGAVR